MNNFPNKAPQLYYACAVRRLLTSIAVSSLAFALVSFPTTFCSPVCSDCVLVDQSQSGEVVRGGDFEKEGRDGCSNEREFEERELSSV